ncbi:MAG: PadR family transcriptional regulator [Anaerolineales bacterium]|jgi:DNA-binding PadR family transcriptional regulator
MSPRRRSPLTIEYILLGLLYRAPKHGYELNKELKSNQGLSHIWRVKPSKLYSLLDRLENQGLLSSRAVPSQKAPDRKEFQLTAEGERVFIDWVRTPVDSARHMRLVFHARLFFALELGEDKAIKLIDAQREECRGWIDSLRARLVALENPDFITGQVFTYRINQVVAMLNWLDDCEKHIRAGRHLQTQE